MADYKAASGSAVASLFAGATVWGLIWYPYRLIEAAGISGALASVLTYAVALVIGLLVFAPKLRGLRPDGWLIAIALAAAGCNLGYVLAMLNGQVMRVLLLFYLAPLWTLLLARLLLHERLTATGGGLVALSLAGAAIMLWRPDLGAPWPTAQGEWIGLGAGFLFALTNVLIRRAHHYPVELKSLATFLGVVVVGGTYVALFETPTLPTPTSGTLWLIGGVGLVLLAINPIVQYGLMRIAAGRAMVILLSELVVAAIGAWWLAGETMSAQEWLGGSLIVSASLLAARMDG